MGTFETYKFLSTLSLRRATIHVGDYIPFNCTFLSTLSLRRATKLVQLSPLQYGYFYPRSPCGERPECHLQISRENGISIHALLAESDVTARIIDPTYGKISIHALLAESDPFSRSGPMTHRYFYPRSPCGERRILGRWVRYGEQFLSTLSLRRATRPAKPDRSAPDNFYPRSPCGERLLPRCRRWKRRRFLSTLSLRRATCSTGTRATSRATFLSTLSLRRATASKALCATAFFLFLSTLSLRRATTGNCPPYPGRSNFYPRSPCGERRPSLIRKKLNHYFYPRSPCGERP